MSDLAPGSVSLEDDNPSLESLSAPPTPETPAGPQPAATETPQPPADADPDGTIEGSGGVKFVPLGAVVDLRGKVREKETALAAKDAEIAALKDKAAKFDQVAHDWNRVQPLIQQMQQHQTPPKPAGPLSQQDAVEYARDLDLYKADGTPDVDRAQRLALRQQTLAQQSAQQAVQPLYQNSAQERSAANFERAASFKDKNGVQVDRATLQRIWSLVPPELSANPETAGVLYKQAVADMVLAGVYKPGAAPPPPAQHTESLGGNSAVTKELSKLDRDMIAAGQIKTKDYESISANFKPGQTNSLE